MYLEKVYKNIVLDVFLDVFISIYKNVVLDVFLDVFISVYKNVCLRKIFLEKYFLEK